MKILSCILLLLRLLSFTETHAQKKINSVTINDRIIYATVDRPGELYIVTKKGEIQRFDVDGNLMSVYRNQPAPTLFDPRDGARLFVYFRQDQRYSYMNPSLELSKSQIIDPALAVEPWLICSSGDHNLWILDAADVSIKKINVASSSVEVDNKIADTLIGKASEITFMREYQGFLFLLHQAKGILIFNKMGRWLKTIEVPQLKYFNFLGEELYYPEGNKLKFLNLFTTETRESPNSQPGGLNLVTDERMYTVEESTLGFFSLNP